MGLPRETEIIFFDSGTVEVRSRPMWVAILEFWFLYVHEFWSHKTPVRLPTGNKDWWGDDGFEAAFHHFYTWTLNHGVEIDKTARYTELQRSPREAEKQRLWDEQLRKDMGE